MQYRWKEFGSLVDWFTILHRNANQGIGNIGDDQSIVMVRRDAECQINRWRIIAEFAHPTSVKAYF